MYKNIFYIIIILFLYSCSTGPRSNYYLVHRIMNNPDSLYLIYKDTSITETKSNHYQVLIERDHLLKDIELIKLFNKEGYDIHNEKYYKLSDKDIDNKKFIHVIILKSRESGKYLVFDFSNRENGKWKLKFINWVYDELFF